MPNQPQVGWMWTDVLSGIFSDSIKDTFRQVCRPSVYPEHSFPFQMWESAVLRDKYHFLHMPVFFLTAFCAYTGSSILPSCSQYISCLVLLDKKVKSGWTVPNPLSGNGHSYLWRNLLWSSLFATTFFQPVSVSFHHKFSGQVFESAPYWSEEYSPHFSFPQVYNDNIEPIFCCWTDAVFLLEHFLTCTVIDFFFQKRSVFFSVLYG